MRAYAAFRPDPRGVEPQPSTLVRAAQVNDLVTRSISGHQTERMQHHYSTVNGGEQRAALSRVVAMFEPGRAAE